MNKTSKSPWPPGVYSFWPLSMVLEVSVKVQKGLNSYGAKIMSSSMLYYVLLLLLEPKSILYPKEYSNQVKRTPSSLL